MGPAEQDVEWNDQGVKGVYRFLGKVWGLINSKFQIPNSKQIQNSKFKIRNSRFEIQNLERLRHKTIKKVSEDIEGFRFNTAVSALMEYVNQLTENNQQLTIAKDLKLQAETLLLLLAPMVPHIAEELWQRMGHKKNIFEEKWPKYNPDLIIEKEIEMIIQINGKMRDKVKVQEDIKEDEAKELALGREKVQKHLKGQEIQKIIFVPRRLINIVI
jgi:leucyl-tRNA synthetase